MELLRARVAREPDVLQRDTAHSAFTPTGWLPAEEHGVTHGVTHTRQALWGETAARDPPPTYLHDVRVRQPARRRDLARGCATSERASAAHTVVEPGVRAPSDTRATPTDCRARPGMRKKKRNETKRNGTERNDRTTTRLARERGEVVLRHALRVDELDCDL